MKLLRQMLSYKKRDAGVWSWRFHGDLLAPLLSQRLLSFSLINVFPPLPQWTQSGIRFPSKYVDLLLKTLSCKLPTPDNDTLQNQWNDAGPFASNDG